MKEILLILSAAAVMLAGYPFMRKADEWIARCAAQDEAQRRAEQAGEHEEDA